MSRNTEIPGYGLARIVNERAPGCVPIVLVIGLALFGVSGLAKKNNQYGETGAVEQRAPKRSPIEQTPVQSKPDNRYASGIEIVKRMPFGRNIKDEQSTQESQVAAPEQAPQSDNREGICGKPLPEGIESGDMVIVFTIDGEQVKGKLIEHSGIPNSTRFIVYPFGHPRVGCREAQSITEVSQ